jgi:hypothetical protein
VLNPWNTVRGTTLLLALLADPVPIEFIAFTVNVYVVPIVNPLIVMVPDPA